MILLNYFFKLLIPFDREEWNKIIKPFSRPLFLLTFFGQIVIDMNYTILIHLVRTLFESITISIVCKITLFITGDLSKRSTVRLFFALFLFYLPISFIFVIYMKEINTTSYTILQYECLYGIIAVIVLLLLKQTKLVLIRTNIFDYNVNVVKLLLSSIRSILCIIEITDNALHNKIEFLTIILLINHLIVVYSQSSQIYSYRCFTRFDEILFDTTDNICAICMEHTQSGVILRCNHIFHKHCLLDWIFTSSRCPLCQKSLRKKSPLREELDMINTWIISEYYSETIIVNNNNNIENDINDINDQSYQNNETFDNFDENDLKNDI